LINIFIFSDKIQLLNSENERLQKEQDRLIEIQAKLINESRKREQDLRKQVNTEKLKTRSYFVIIESNRN
jgi:hypothetical protein